MNLTFLFIAAALILGLSFAVTFWMILVKIYEKLHVPILPNRQYQHYLITNIKYKNTSTQELNRNQAIFHIIRIRNLERLTLNLLSIIFAISIGIGVALHVIIFTYLSDSDTASTLLNLSTDSIYNASSLLDVVSTIELIILIIVSAVLIIWDRRKISKMLNDYELTNRFYPIGVLKKTQEAARPLADEKSSDSKEILEDKTADFVRTTPPIKKSDGVKATNDKLLPSSQAQERRQLDHSDDISK